MKVPIPDRLSGPLTHTNLHVAARRKQVNAGKKSLFREEVLERQVFCKPADIHRRTELRHASKRLNFRTEQKSIAEPRVVNRLHTKPIPRDGQNTLFLVPNCEREHAVETPQRIYAPLYKGGE